MKRSYDELSAELLPEIVRWEHASFVMNQLEPFHCERHGWKPGRRLKKAPKERGYSYGFSASGQLLVAREGQFEYFHVDEGDTVTRLQFDRSDIAWAKKQKWNEKEQARAKALKSQARLLFRDRRLQRVEATWPGHPMSVEQYEYDGKGRVTRVRVARPRHTDELSYDARGELVRVVSRPPRGKVWERFRRPSKGDDLPALLPQIRKKLAEQIPRVLGRAKLRDAAYAVVISTCLEEAPHLLPPRITVALVKDRDARMAKGGEFAKSEIWNPESMPLFDDQRLELRDRALVALCKRANVAREDDGPVLVMLRVLAAELQRRGLGDVLPAAPELLVYAMDVGDEDGAAAARRMAPKAIMTKLRAMKLR